RFPGPPTVPLPAACGPPRVGGRRPPDQSGHPVPRDAARLSRAGGKHEVPERRGSEPGSTRTRLRWGDRPACPPGERGPGGVGPGRTRSAGTEKGLARRGLAVLALSTPMTGRDQAPWLFRGLVGNSLPILLRAGKLRLQGRRV